MSEKWQGRAVLHVDMDAFFASVEQLDHPEWRGKPVIVGGPKEGRGVVSAASYEARRFGVRSAMPSAQASKMCPGAIWAAPRFARYSELSKLVRGFFEDETPAVEQVSIDEAYLDVTPGETGDDPVEVAERIQRRVDAIGLSCSIGVATSKTVAKVASDHDKPHGITVVRPGREAAFLAPLPVGVLQGVGKATREGLARIGVRTVGDLASSDAATLSHAVGSFAADLVLRARGIDDRPVAASSAVKSVSNERTFAHDLRDAAELRDAAHALTEKVACRLRSKGLAGRTVTVKLRYSDFTTRTVRKTLPFPTDLEAEIAPVVDGLLEGTWSPGTGLRLLGVGVSGFSEPSRQMEMFSEEPETDERRRALSKSLDEVRRRFGDDSISTGSRLKKRGTGQRDDASKGHRR